MRSFHNASCVARILKRTSGITNSKLMAEEGYKIRNQAGIHFITFSVVEWVDTFTRHIYADIVVDSLKYCQQEK